MPTYNKITLNGTTLIDLSTDTVAVADDIASGKVGHLNTGATATGTHSGGGGGGGSGGSASDDVRFLDYDGTILYSYSAEDFANLSAMPANPSHTGLTAQGWNWSLATAKTYVATCGMLDIGQMYITDNGKTRIYISLVDSARLSPYLGIGPNGTVVVDWGDNTATDTLTGTSLTTVKRAQHTYASMGDYVITLTVTSGSFAILGLSTNGSWLLTRTDTGASSQRCYQNAIQKVELGANVSIGDYAFNSCFSLASITIPSSVMSIFNTSAFNYCTSLASVTIPSSVTSIGTYTFQSCYSLASVTIPSGVTKITRSAFSSCISLARVTIPSSVTSIDISAFYNCYSLASVTIPSGVTTIESSAFQSCNGVAEYHFLSTTPPTLVNTNAFTGILSDCKIYVPSASLSTYQSASNWSTYASYMVGE